ncbi:unnamed protein product [Effrenium voratum]|nr:unnamed protein product [Effrenium voratum]
MQVLVNAILGAGIQVHTDDILTRVYSHNTMHMTGIRLHFRDANPFGSGNLNEDNANDLIGKGQQAVLRRFSACAVTMERHYDNSNIIHQHLVQLDHVNQLLYQQHNYLFH